MRVNTIAINIGCSKTTIYELGVGIVLCEATCIAISGDGPYTVKAVGNEANKLVGKTSESTRVIWPVEEGEIENEKALVLLMQKFFEMISVKRFHFKPRVILSIPCGSENALLKKYERVLGECGIYNIDFVECPILVALGVGAPITEANPCFFIDIGGGTTQFSAVSLDGVIVGANVNMGGKNIDAMLIDHIEDKYHLKIGTLTAERLKIKIGSLSTNDDVRTVVNGRDIETGNPVSVSLCAQDIVEPIKAFFDMVFKIAKKVLAKLPAEVSADIKRAGIYLVGGTSKTAGLEMYFVKNMNMRANMTDEPDMAPAIGGGILAGKKDVLNKLKLNKR